MASDRQDKLLCLFPGFAYSDLHSRLLINVSFVLQSLARSGGLSHTREIIRFQNSPVAVLARNSTSPSLSRMQEIPYICFQLCQTTSYFVSIRFIYKTVRELRNCTDKNYCTDKNFCALPRHQTDTDTAEQIRTVAMF